MLNVPFAALVAASLAASLALCLPASAAETAADAPAATADPALDAQIAAYLAASSRPLPTAPQADVMGPTDGPVRDGKVHGEVGVGFGTGGYREGYASMIAPVGETGTVAVAVDKVQGRGFRGGRASGQSLSIAGSFGAGTNHQPACAGLKDKADFEPLWVSRMQASNPAAGGVDCATKP
jgi:hypothetical protein